VPQDDEGSIEETDAATSEESLDTHDAPPTRKPDQARAGHAAGGSLSVYGAPCYCNMP